MENLEKIENTSSKVSTSTIITATTTSSSLSSTVSKLNAENLVANAFLMDNMSSTGTGGILHPSQPPPPPSYLQATQNDKKDKPHVFVDQKLQLLDTKTDAAEKFITDKTRSSTPPPPPSPFSSLDAFGPAINEPQKPRWLSSLHSVIFIITCALAIFIVFRNVLTW